MLENHKELDVIAVKEFKENEEMYKVIDFLNRNLKSQGIIFGLKRKGDNDIISIYKSNSVE